MQNNEKDENLVYRLLKMNANVEGREIHFPFRIKRNLLQMINPYPTNVENRVSS